MEESSRSCCTSMVVLLCTVQINCSSTTSCQLSNIRALFNSIVVTIPIGRSLPKPSVPAIPISGRSLKVVAPTSPIHINLPKSNVQAIPINKQPVKSFASTISIDRQSPSSFVWALPIIEKHQTSTVQTIPINGQSLKSIVKTNQLIEILQNYLSGQFQLLDSCCCCCLHIK